MLHVRFVAPFAAAGVVLGASLAAKSRRPSCPHAARRRGAEPDAPPAAAGSALDERRRRRARQERLGLRRLLPVRLRRLAQGDADPGGRASWTRSFDVIQETQRERSSARSSSGYARGAGARTSPTRRSSATSTPRAWTSRRSRRPALGRSSRDLDAHRRASRPPRTSRPAARRRSTRAGVRAAFAFDSGQDFKDATQVIGIVDQGGLGLPDRDYYLKDEPRMREIRDAVPGARRRRCSSSLGEKPADAAAHAATVIAVETALAEAADGRASIGAIRRRSTTAIDRAGLEQGARPRSPGRRTSTGSACPRSPRSTSRSPTSSRPSTRARRSASPRRRAGKPGAKCPAPARGASPPPSGAPTCAGTCVPRRGAVALASASSTRTSASSAGAHRRRGAPAALEALRARRPTTRMGEALAQPVREDRRSAPRARTAVERMVAAHRGARCTTNLDDARAGWTTRRARRAPREARRDRQQDRLPRQVARATTASTIDRGDRTSATVLRARRVRDAARSSAKIGKPRRPRRVADDARRR